MDMTDLIKVKFQSGCISIIALWIFIATIILAAILLALGVCGIGTFIFLVLLGLLFLIIF